MAEGGPSPADPLFREDRPPVTGDGIWLLANYRLTSGRGSLARCIIGQDKLCHEVGCEDVSTVGLARPCCPTLPLQEGAATSRPPGLSGAVKPADICRSARCAAPDVNQTLSRQRPHRRYIRQPQSPIARSTDDTMAHSEQIDGLDYTCRQYGEHTLQRVGIWQPAPRRNHGYWAMYEIPCHPFPVQLGRSAHD